MTDGKIFRGQTAKLEINGVVVGALQDAEIEVSFDYEELEGQTIKVLDRQVTRVTPSVSATYGSFDLEAVKELINYDDEEGSIADSPEPPEFDVTGTFTSTDGEEEFEATVQDVFFDSVSLDWARDDHVETGLSGEGTDITNINDLTAE